MVEQTASMEIIEPEIENMQFKGSLTGSLDPIAERLSKLQNLTIKKEADKITAFNVENRDIENRPFLFYIIIIEKNKITVNYSIMRDSSEKMRKLQILRNLMGILSLISDLYKIDIQTFFQYVDSAIDNIINSLAQNYSSLFNSYDSLLSEHKELRRLNIELTNSNRNLTAQATRITAENEVLKARLKELENYSDESLMVMVQDWIESHSNTIDINEFAKTYKITLPRVEQILNKMVISGYLEVRG
ncbi:hypothetical protein M1614_02400 [Candidatus Marsarchaeota archaeon]|jgi:hypothetical protein|nr:hypothetical protein [Candidatus Marsarchaeota archaeon]MCL5089556.1 hypothetical protein [Candidatus Marsarchaeota archaeon]